jgi:hypothetical protein
MDLTTRLLRFAAARPHVLVVPAVGGTAQRLAVESEIARRGWPTATSPADTDLIVVAGHPGPALASVVETLWQQLPAPRARADVHDATTVTAALDQAVDLLGDARHQRHEPELADPPLAAEATAPHSEAQHQSGPDVDGHRTGHQHDGQGGDGHDHGTHSHGGPDTGAHDDGGHGEMEMPGGLPMADLGEDRDGLMLDQLHVPLGPVLPDWPAGLVVEVVLQGDVVQHAEARVLDGGPRTVAGGSFWTEPGPHRAFRLAARQLDSLARLLGVAGWTDPAATARRLRDEFLGADGPRATTRTQAVELIRKVRRSRTLRRMLRDTRPVDVADLLDRRLMRLRAALDDLDHPTSILISGMGGGSDLDRLAGLLVGAELAAARLIIAAFDPDPDAVASGAVEGSRHG